jgi:hypothetical protein
MAQDKPARPNQPQSPGDQPTSPGAARIEGKLRLEATEQSLQELELKAYAFDKAGQLLGRGDVDANGALNLPLQLQKPRDIELVVSPEQDPKLARSSAEFSRTFAAAEFKEDRGMFVLRPELSVSQVISSLWRPLRICISGHVRKIKTLNGITQACPVPFVKVEVFDVDREGCWWPFINRWWDKLLDRPVVRIPDLMRERPFPPVPPLPDPIGPLVRDLVPELQQTFENPGALRGFNPQPEPPGVPFTRPGTLSGFNPQPDPPSDPTRWFRSPGELVGLNPQPLPPRVMQTQLASVASSAQLAESAGRVGEMKLLSGSIASRLEKLTLVSKIAPWVIFQRCFYSTAKVCEATTDCSGYWRCCFRWFPLHVRRGRLRFDARPDIIVRVTQVINGVETVVYMDPYTSTRWDVSGAHIDLYLDNENVQCGSGCGPTPPAGTTVFFTRVGNDEVYKIDQPTGTFGNTAFGGSYSNWAYGGSLYLSAVIGDGLSSGAPKRYYRLSLRKNGGGFDTFVKPLSDTRVAKGTFISDVYSLGPQPVGAQPNLYEIRDTQNFYWYNRDLIAIWPSEDDEDDTGFYTVRMEIFDELGNALTSAVVDYRDGTVPPPGPLPPMPDHCDLNLRIDNKYPTGSISFPTADPVCGVVKWAQAASLTLDVNVSQPHNRLWTWSLSCYKGLTGGYVNLGPTASDTNYGGISPLPVVRSIPGTPLTAGLTGTCAFALTLNAWPLVRNGYGVIHNFSVPRALAIEKCSPSLPVVG